MRPPDLVHDFLQMFIMNERKAGSLNHQPNILCGDRFKLRDTAMSDMKNRILTLARETGLSDKASLSDFLRWRASERAKERHEMKKR
jgi:hypothetical protein